MAGLINAFKLLLLLRPWVRLWLAGYYGALSGQGKEQEESGWHGDASWKFMIFGCNRGSRWRWCGPART